MIKRPSRKISEYRDFTKSWLDKNEIHDGEIHQFLKEQINKSGQRIFSSYPDLSLTYKALSDHLNTPIDHLFLANGSDSIIKSVFENFLRKGDKIFLRSPTFAMYEVYSSCFDSSLTRFEYKFKHIENRFNWDKDTFEKNIIEIKPKLIFIANPDSPTGSYFSEEYLYHLLGLAKKVGTVVCLDAVYDHFSPSPLDYNKLIKDFKNLLIVYSASKSWGLAGVRVGYSISSAELSKKLHVSRPMYEIGNLQAFIFEKALHNTSLFNGIIKKVLSNKTKVESYFKNSNLMLVNTIGNFIIFEELQELNKILEEKIIIRSNWNSGPMKGLSRMSIGSEMDFKFLNKCIDMFSKGINK